MFQEVSGSADNGHGRSCAPELSLFLSDIVSTDITYMGLAVRKMPSWPSSRANFSLLQLCSHRSAWASLRLLGQPKTVLAIGPRQVSLIDQLTFKEHFAAIARGENSPGATPSFYHDY